MTPLGSCVPSGAQGSTIVAPSIVLYHDVVPTATPFEARIDVTTPPDVFAAHVAYYERHFDVIDLDTLLGGRLPRRPLLITFDDSYRSVVTAAEDVLHPRGLPAVLFANPGVLAGRPPALDNVLSWFAETHGLEELASALDLREPLEVGALLRGPLAGFGATARAEVRDELADVGGLDDAALLGRSPVLTEEDLAQLPSLGVEIGNHTSTHVHCRALDDAERADEVVGAQRELERLSGQRVRAFSVPYGHEDDLTPAVLGAVRDSGHEAVFLVHARSNRFRPDPDTWYRVSLHDEPARQLRTELRVLPALRTAKQLVTA